MTASFSLKNFDMFGQSIKFSYNNSNVFSSFWGGIISLMVATLIIIYTLLYIFDILKLDKPNVLYVVENFYSPPKFYIISDLIGYFDEKSPYYNITKEETIDTSMMQLGFGLQDTDTLDLLPFDPSYFYLNLTYLSRSYQNSDIKSIPLFFDYCKRFPFASQFIFDNYHMNKTYCVYSPFILHGSENNGYYKAFSMSMHKCQNNTITNVKKESLDEYQRIKYVYNQMKNRTFVNLKIFFESDPKEMDLNVFQDESYEQYFNITQPLININSNLKNMIDIKDNNEKNDLNPSWPNPYIKLKYSSDNIAIVCKPENEISKRLINTRIVFFYLSNHFNTTNFKQTTSPYMQYKMMYHTENIHKQITMTLLNDKIITYNAILPPTMLNKSDIEYFMHESDYFQYLYGDPSFNAFFKFKIESASLRRIFERKYTNILDILGIVGGLSRIFIIIGFCFVSYCAYIKTKEKFINETYNVIDPKNLEKISRSFTEFIKEITLNKENYKKSNFKNQTYLEEYFCERLDEINELIQTNDKNIIKYKILYEVFKQGAYSGFSYNYFEIVLKMCCCCFFTKKFRHKNLTFKKACKELEKDNDFRSIFKSIKDFESLKRCFLDEGQYNLLNAIANPEITWRNVRNKKIMKNDSTGAVKNSANFVRTNREHFNKIVGLEMALDEILNKREKNETDLALLNSLINNEELIDSVNKIVKFNTESDQEIKDLEIENHVDRDVEEAVELNENDFKQMIDIFR